MNDYLIKKVSKAVQVQRIINGETEVLRLNGEVNFQLDDFWPSFKRKIEYEIGDSIAFLILSDDAHFEIDPEILIAKEFVSSKDKLHRLILNENTYNYHILTYPYFDTKEISSYTPLQAKQNIPELLNENKEETLESFYSKKTRKIEIENLKVTGGK